jgi:hypothetical protein
MYCTCNQTMLFSLTWVSLTLLLGSRRPPVRVTLRDLPSPRHGSNPPRPTRLPSTSAPTSPPHHRCSCGRAGHVDTPPPGTVGLSLGQWKGVTSTNTRLEKQSREFLLPLTERPRLPLHHPFSSRHAPAFIQPTFRPAPLAPPAPASARPTLIKNGTHPGQAGGARLGRYSTPHQAGCPHRTPAICAIARPSVPFTDTRYAGLHRLGTDTTYAGLPTHRTG